MIRIFPNEQWKEFSVEHSSTARYAVSNYGRLMKFVKSMEDGFLLNGGHNHGYKTFTYCIRKNNKSRSRYLFVRRLVAETFIPKTSADQEYVLLLDYNKNNNFVENLKWATWDEMRAHRKNSPGIKAAFIRQSVNNKKLDGPKLTITKVMLIKKKLQDPNRKSRMKTLAKQFGVSEMQLYRIKSGENWGHIKVD